MTIHCFANFLTHYGTAANNRGENQGNSTTLQKLLWDGRTHTTVSAEAIRFALRRRLEEAQAGSCNRRWIDDADELRKMKSTKPINDWRDGEFSAWTTGKGTIFADDDLLGFMKADAANKEGEDGKAVIRRAVLELTRAVSLTPWAGDCTFNAASPGATPSAAKGKGINPAPYAAEIHATRYQYGLAMTPARLRDPKRAALAIEQLCALGEVAGNHARFLYDFSPESAVFRITNDPAPRLLYCFAEVDGAVSFPALLATVQAQDIKADELVIAGAIVANLDPAAKAVLTGATLLPGIRAAAAEVAKRLTNAKG
ncbi:MAG: type I-B CRISPR-associated protein Cas7/Cst2/DevR [Planctomycetes bacterium]|nr:type I-B CRISPR-associated protein Cas7/Cst2/DevR [Planctomycetota bacterium]